MGCGKVRHQNDGGADLGGSPIHTAELALSAALSVHGAGFVGGRAGVRSKQPVPCSSLPLLGCVFICETEKVMQESGVFSEVLSFCASVFFLLVVAAITLKDGGDVGESRVMGTGSTDLVWARRVKAAVHGRHWSTGTRQ